MTLEWYDYVRIGNIVVALATMYFLGLHLIRHPGTFSTKIRDYWWALNAMLFTMVVGSTEQIVRDRPETGALFIAFFAALVCLKATWNRDFVVSSRSPETDRKTNMRS